MFSQFWIAGVLELVGGFLIAVGLFTRPVAFLLAGEMAFAYFMAHAPRHFFPVRNGGENVVLFCFSPLPLRHRRRRTASTPCCAAGAARRRRRAAPVRLRPEPTPPHHPPPATTPRMTHLPHPGAARHGRPTRRGGSPLPRSAPAPRAAPSRGADAAPAADSARASSEIVADLNASPRGGTARTWRRTSPSTPTPRRS
jgi:hypothetical protein